MVTVRISAQKPENMSQREFELVCALASGAIKQNAVYEELLKELKRQQEEAQIEAKK